MKVRIFQVIFLEKGRERMGKGLALRINKKNRGKFFT